MKISRRMYAKCRLVEVHFGVGSSMVKCPVCDLSCGGKTEYQSLSFWRRARATWRDSEKFDERRCDDRRELSALDLPFGMGE